MDKLNFFSEISQTINEINKILLKCIVFAIL